MGKGLFGDCCQHHIRHIAIPVLTTNLESSIKMSIQGSVKLVNNNNKQQQSQSGLGTIRGRSRIFLYDSKSRND